MQIKDEVRDTILEVARKIFSHFGFKKTTVDEIAQAARKGKSSIYYYFNSKEDIFKAVVEKEASMLIKEIEIAMKGIQDPKEQLKTYIITRIQTFKNLANFYAAVKNEYLAHFDFIDKIRIKYDLEEIKTIQRILQNGIDNYDFIIKDTQTTAKVIAIALKGLEIPVFLEKENYNFEGKLDELLNVLFYGLVKR
jgi:AcrR family transcriptional regulator